jgi:hypothetical protein
MRADIKQTYIIFEGVICALERKQRDEWLPKPGRVMKLNRHFANMISMINDRAKAADVVVVQMGYNDVGDCLDHAGAAQVRVGGTSGINERKRTRASLHDSGGTAELGDKCPTYAKKPYLHDALPAVEQLT